MNFSEEQLEEVESMAALFMSVRDIFVLNSHQSNRIISSIFLKPNTAIPYTKLTTQAGSALKSNSGHP